MTNEQEYIESFIAMVKIGDPERFEARLGCTLFQTLRGDYQIVKRDFELGRSFIAAIEAYLEKHEEIEQILIGDKWIEQGGDFFHWGEGLFFEEFLLTGKHTLDIHKCWTITRSILGDKNVVG